MADFQRELEDLHSHPIAVLSEDEPTDQSTDSGGTGIYSRARVHTNESRTEGSCLLWALQQLAFAVLCLLQHHADMLVQCKFTVASERPPVTSNGH